MSQFKWKKYGNFAITANGYSIAKYIVDGKDKYGLWELPNKLIKIHNKPQEAKENAMEHYQTKPSVSDS
jgi:hypothetical protein